MALRDLDKQGFLGYLNQNADSTTVDELSRRIQQLKAQGATDDDLKPLYDAMTQKGFNINAGTGTVTGGPTSVTNPQTGVTGPASPGSTSGGSVGTLTPGTPATPTTTDRDQIEQEAARERQQSLDVLQKQVDLRSGGLSTLGDILQKQNQAQFAYDLPGIKEDLQSSGLFSSPSALASAVARESGMLGANTAAQLGQYGLGSIDLQTQGLSNINNNQLQLQQGGLQRQFSLADYDKQAALAREIRAMSVPDSPDFSFGGAAKGALGGAGTGFAIGGPAGAVIGGGVGAVGGGSGSYFCTHLKNIGLATQEEVDQVHEKVVPEFSHHPADLFLYAIFAPLFVRESLGIDWKQLKINLIDEIIDSKDSREAYSKYRSVCINLIPQLLPSTKELFLKVA